MNRNGRFSLAVITLLIASLACAPLQGITSNSPSVSSPSATSSSEEEDTGNVSPTTETTSSSEENSNQDLDPSDTYESILPEDGEPLNLSLEESGESISEFIGPEGGVLSVTSNDGATFELSIPENAIPSSLEITLTPVEPTTEGPFAKETFSGIRMEPDGLLLLKPAHLTITPKDITPDEAIGMASGSEGEDAYLTLGEPGEDGYQIQVHHFSNASIITKYGSQLDGLYRKWRPGDAHRRAMHEMTRLKEKAEKVGGFTAGAFYILMGWGDNVAEQLKQAMGNSNKLDEALASFLIWKARVGLLDKNFKEINERKHQHKLEELKKLASLAMVNAINEAKNRCLNQKDPQAALDIWRWTVLTYLLELDTDVAENAGIPALQQCYVFKFEFSDKLDSQGERPLEMEVTSTFDVYIKDEPSDQNPAFKSFGSGEIKIEDFKIKDEDINSRCTYTPEAGLISLDMESPLVFGDPTDYRTGIPEGHVAMRLMSNTAPTVTAACEVEGQSQTYQFSAWFDTFTSLHVDRFIPPSILVFNIPVVQQGDVYAKLEKAQERTGEAGNTVSEELTIQLVHTPR